MGKDTDIFGQLLLTQYASKDNPVYEIIERDDGLIGVSSAQKYFSAFPDWAPEERRAIKLAKGRVLDIGCGAGRHALYLQKNGMDVTGIDLSEGAIALCKKLGLKNAYVCSVEHLKGLKPCSFDTVGMFYKNFGLLQSHFKAKHILKELYRITSPQAQIIADSTDLRVTRNPVHISYQALNRKRGRLEGQLRIRLRFKRLIGKWFDYLLVSPKEMNNLLEGTGWEIGRLFKGKAGSYVAILKKGSERTTKRKRQRLRDSAEMPCAIKPR